MMGAKQSGTCFSSQRPQTRVQGHPGVYRKLHTSQDFIVRLSQKKKSVDTHFVMVSFRANDLNTSVNGYTPATEMDQWVKELTMQAC